MSTGPQPPVRAARLSPEQLRAMRKAGRPPIGNRARKLIAIRVDQDVLARLREDARRRRIGYQTLINQVLADYARKLKS
jgi:uncharacterized protein (DUF4415 family)